MSNILIDRENDVIPLDKDTPEDQDEGGLYPYDPTKEDIDIREDPQTVFELIRKINQGKIIIDPDFQRNIVWKPEQKSKFIESIILNFPLPPWYIHQTIDGKYIIVDGLQRTSTLYDFINNKFQLKGLEILPKLNGYKFSDLNYRSHIEDKKLTFYVLRPSVNSKIIVDIFNRINIGGIPLNRQETRNRLFSGKSTKLLKELSEQKYFREAINKNTSSKRMQDREIILRYLAFKIFDYKKYNFNSMSELLDITMQRINEMNELEINNLKDDFERIMKLTFSFFGADNFRLFPINNHNNSQRSKINMALMESVAYFFSIKDDEFLNINRHKITDNFYRRLLNNSKYLESIRFATSRKTRVISRFTLAQEILGDV